MSDLPRVLRQPDQRSCGAACMVVARLVTDPDGPPVVSSVADFETEVLAMHRHLTGLTDPGGRMQLPWPRAIGTPPWAVRRELSAITGVGYGIDLGRTSPEQLYARIEERAGSTTPVALYVGSRWLPRHVVLVLDGADGALRVYQPSVGRVLLSRREAFVEGRLRLGWPTPWLAVLPG